MYQFVETGKIYKVFLNTVSSINNEFNVIDIELEVDVDDEDLAEDQASRLAVERGYVQSDSDVISVSEFERYSEIVANPIERKVGEVFKIGNKFLSVNKSKGDNCANCFFMKETCGFSRVPVDLIGACKADARSDNSDVFFKYV